METARRSAVGAFVLGGTVSAAVLSWYAAGLNYPLIAFEHPVQLLPSAVFFVLGGLPAFLLVRNRVLTPAIVAVLTIGVWIWSEADPGPGDPLIGLVFVTAPTGLALMLVSAWIELWVRRRLTA
ncbi:TRAP dicarboxylate transporter subunit DctM [Natrialba sp. SSL1]|uniref:TRAP dicarboxylate transporter subunit DctM n=1 Tax=Natrialba sp. SSL1 TaxID=1869245 RepID=UPI0008F809A5|nr:TRAP dicarboxylate transporter subunit DctM [Natrialba sp. SSL1]OIB59369.1 TRAP dicarboxylate transporter subunit DctM [Natrialba sp. SSL1]